MEVSHGHWRDWRVEVRSRRISCIQPTAVARLGASFSFLAHRHRPSGVQPESEFQWLCVESTFQNVLVGRVRMLSELNLFLSDQRHKSTATGKLLLWAGRKAGVEGRSVGLTYFCAKVNHDENAHKGDKSGVYCRPPNCQIGNPGFHPAVCRSFIRSKWVCLHS